MSSKTEYKLQAVWSFKKETFLNTKWNDTKSENFKTPFSGVEYFFELFRGETSYSTIRIYLWYPYRKTTWIKEMKFLIPSANFEADLSTAAINPDNNRKMKNAVHIKREDLLDPEKKFFVNDTLTMEFSGILYYNESDINLGSFLLEQSDKDFAFVVGNQKIKIHKFILGQFSSIFDLKKNQYKIENFDKNVVERVVRLCYVQEISHCEKKKELLFKALEFINVYDMPLLNKHVERELIELMSEKTVCELAKKSMEYKCDKLRAFCVNFISNCIKDGKHFDGYADLHPEIVLEVFKNTACKKSSS